jgi:hypothetical protein
MAQGIETYEDDLSTKFFISLQVDLNGYSRSGPGFGIGAAIGIDNGIGFGLRFLYIISAESLNVMEIVLFLRFYVLNPDIQDSLFLQLEAGASVSGYEKISFPSEEGSFSGGLALGWRFLSIKGWFVETFVRAGYPHIYGAGLSFGKRMP